MGAKFSGVQAAFALAREVFSGAQPLPATGGVVQGVCVVEHDGLAGRDAPRRLHDQHKVSADCEVRVWQARVGHERGIWVHAAQTLRPTCLICWSTHLNKGVRGLKIVTFSYLQYFIALRISNFKD
jgi:hypothetical protein